MKRVVITGIGLISPIGNSANESWEGICFPQAPYFPIMYGNGILYQYVIADKNTNYWHKIRHKKQYGIKNAQKILI